MVEAVALGVDMFDCVLPTRLARHGTALTATGRLNVRSGVLAGETEPLEAGCACPVCARWSRAYLRHLVTVGEPSAGRLLTIHNLAWTMALLARTRQAVVEGSLARLRGEVAAAWP
jgi:queuine tRNA-ribosyltransferase